MLSLVSSATERGDTPGETTMTTTTCDDTILDCTSLLTDMHLRSREDVLAVGELLDSGLLTQVCASQDSACEAVSQ